MKVRAMDYWLIEMFSMWYWVIYGLLTLYFLVFGKQDSDTWHYVGAVIACVIGVMVYRADYYANSNITVSVAPGDVPDQLAANHLLREKDDKSGPMVMHEVTFHNSERGLMFWSRFHDKGWSGNGTVETPYAKSDPCFVESASSVVVPLGLPLTNVEKRRSEIAATLIIPTKYAEAFEPTPSRKESKFQDAAEKLEFADGVEEVKLTLTEKHSYVIAWRWLSSQGLVVGTGAFAVVSTVWGIFYFLFKESVDEAKKKIDKKLLKGSTLTPLQESDDPKPTDVPS